MLRYILLPQSQAFRNLVSNALWKWTYVSSKQNVDISAPSKTFKLYYYGDSDMYGVFRVYYWALDLCKHHISHWIAVYNRCIRDPSLFHLSTDPCVSIIMRIICHQFVEMMKNSRSTIGEKYTAHIEPQYFLSRLFEFHAEHLSWKLLGSLARIVCDTGHRHTVLTTCLFSNCWRPAYFPVTWDEVYYIDWKATEWTTSTW